MDSQVRFEQNFIQHLKNIFITLLYRCIFVTQFGIKLQIFLGYFFVTFWEYECRVFFKFLSELSDNLSLVEVCSLRLIKKNSFLALLNEDQLEIVEPLFNKLKMRKMAEVFLDSLYTFICISIDSMSFCVNDCTKLYNKLLESYEIKFLSFSFVEHLDINVTDKRHYLIF